MDSFERKIEEYKQELIKYAKNHGTVYYEEKGAFNTVSPEAGEESASQQVSAAKYNAAYVSNRPMPPEYDGEEQPDSPALSPSGSAQAEETAINTRRYASADEFLADNTKTGRLKVQAYASAQVFPIQNAKVTVEKDFADGTYQFAENYTDIDGIVQNISLATKNKSLSQTSGKEIPYATYRVTVSHPQFETLVFEKVPIFEQIESMQPAAMLPKEKNESSSRSVNDSVPNKSRR